MAKSKYHPGLLILVQGWARDGLTDAQIAHNLGIHVDTFYEWKKRHPEFSEALAKGKEVVDFEVENALLKSALGFDYTEEAVTNKGDVVTVRRVQAPNVTAQIFWLKNRKAKQWRDQKQVEHTGDPERPVEVHQQIDGYLAPIARLVDEYLADHPAADGPRESVDSGDAHGEAGAVPDSPGDGDPLRGERGRR